MLFVVIGRDAPGSAAKRAEFAEAHLEHVERALAHEDVIRVAGPIRNDAGEYTGSLLVLDCEDAEAARAFMERDPYYAAGVWATLSIEPFAGVAGSWVGGRNW